MKTFRLLIVALLVATTASAQHRMRSARHGEYMPTVYLISMHEVDTVYSDVCAARQVAALNRLAVEGATQDYLETHRPGFQQTELPAVRLRKQEQQILVRTGRLHRAAYGL